MAKSHSSSWVGIDPGTSGAIVVISGDALVGTWMMPMRDVVVNGKRRKEVDGFGVDRILKATLEWEPKGIVLEHLWSRPSDTPLTAWSLGSRYSHCRQALESLGKAYHLVSPMSWKRKVLGAKENWVGNKQASVDFIKREYPQWSLRVGQQRTDQDGIADALCLALYGRMVHG